LRNADETFKWTRPLAMVAQAELGARATHSAPNGKRGSSPACRLAGGGCLAGQQASGAAGNRLAAGPDAASLAPGARAVS